MKKVLLTIIYPFWFLLSATEVGNMLLIVLVPLTPAMIFYLILPQVFNVTGKDAQDIGMGMAVVSLLLCPLVLFPLMAFGEYLEKNYKEWGYKTEMKFKM